MGPWESCVARAGNPQAFRYTPTLRGVVLRVPVPPEGAGPGTEGMTYPRATLTQGMRVLWNSPAYPTAAQARAACDLYVASLVLAGTIDPEHLLP